jgi:hypothetical protein
VDGAYTWAGLVRGVGGLAGSQGEGGEECDGEGGGFHRRHAESFSVEGSYANYIISLFRVPERPVRLNSLAR